MPQSAPRTKMIPRRLKGLTTLFCLVLILGAALPAMAHRVNIYAWVENGKICSESKFSSNRMVNGGEIKVLDKASRKELLSGKTNDKGEFCFDIPEEASGDLLLMLQAGMGHQNEWTVTAAEYLGAEAKPAAPAEPAKEKNPAVKNSPVGIDSEALAALVRQEVDKALEKQLGPIRKSLVEMSEKEPTLADAASGIGYLVGLAGLILYFRSKNK